MRKLLLLLLPLLLCSLLAQAQTVDTSTYTKKMDWLFQHLSKTPVTTGILYDRVYPAAKLDLFNQGTRQDTSSHENHIQAHSEILAPCGCFHPQTKVP